MNFEILKQTLANILNTEDSEAEPSLLKYIQDVLTRLHSPNTVSSEILTTFLTQIQMLLFQNEGEYVEIIFCDETYHIQSLFRSFSFIGTDIEKLLLTPLNIKADTSQETIQACALRLLPSPPFVPSRSSSPLRHTPEALQALNRYAQSETKEPADVVLGGTENNHTVVPRARREGLSTGIHPLEFHTGTIILGAIGEMAAMFWDAFSNLSEETTEHVDDSYQSSLW